MKRYALAMLAYLVPTVALGFIWHLILFKDYYDALQIYRPDVITPFGFLSMLIQAGIFAWIYNRTLADRADRAASWLARGAVLALIGGTLSWSYTTLAVAAKNVMASVPDYLLIETAFTAVQWLVVGPLMALAFSSASQRGERKVTA
jgi:hypothetical protein